jgi:hypothetical protein
LLLEELRRQRVLLSVPRVPEMLVHRARTRAEQVSYRALAERLTETQLDALDTLLAPKPGTALSGMVWVRQAPQAPAARNMLALVERVRFVRALGIERDRQRNIPNVAFDRRPIRRSSLPQPLFCRASASSSVR